MAVLRRVYYGEDPQASGPDASAFFWPSSDQKRRELYTVRRNHPDAYQSTYQCAPGHRIGSIFLESDFVYYRGPPGLSVGLIDPEVRRFVSQFQAIIIAWDTAFSSNSEANHTVGVVGGLLPCSSFHCGEDLQLFGECEPHMDVYILDLLREKLQWGDITTKFRIMHRKWGATLHVVEQRGAGISLYQSMPSVGINVEGVQVTEGKRARAILGTEAGSTQGWFRQHRIYLPIDEPWVERYKTELKDFTGERDASDDQVDATVHLVNYAIQNGANTFILPSGWTPESVDTVMGVGDTGILENPAQQFNTHAIDTLNWIHMAPSINENPLWIRVASVLIILMGIVLFKLGL